MRELGNFNNPLPSVAYLGFHKGSLPPNTAKRSGGALPQRVQAEPGRQTVSGAF